jgi:hypothetical protein
MSRSTIEALNKAFEEKHDRGNEIIDVFLAATHQNPEWQKMADDYRESCRRVKDAIRGLREES